MRVDPGMPDKYRRLLDDLRSFPVTAFLPLLFLAIAGGCLTARNPLDGACQLPTYVLDVPAKPSRVSVELADLDTIPPGPIVVSPTEGKKVVEKEPEVPQKESEPPEVTEVIEEETPSPPGKPRIPRGRGPLTENEIYRIEQNEIARIERVASKLTPTDPTEAANATIMALAETDPVKPVEDYRIHPKDDILIEVFGEPEISHIYHVSSDGFINHPLLKKVELVGLTSVEAEEKLRKMLAQDYLVDPRVNLRIKSSLARRVIIFGEVENPGSYEVDHDQPMTLLRIISMAGGFTDLAAVGRVRILRDIDGEEKTMKIDVADLLKGRLDETDIGLKPGDIITVPETIF
jgi:polysaccharide export outer membrane protein